MNRKLVSASGTPTAGVNRVSTDSRLPSSEKKPGAGEPSFDHAPHRRRILLRPRAVMISREGYDHSWIG